MQTYNPIKAGQVKVVMVADRSELTIKRPDGSIEVIVNPNTIKELNDVLFKRFVDATKKAGRGQVMSYKNFKKPAEYVVTAADAAVDSSAQIERIMCAGE